jgi:hypothetical protein
MAFTFRFGKNKESNADGAGLILFSSVEEAIKSEHMLKASNYEVKLVAPPPHLRKGCDLALEMNVVEKAGIERLLTDRAIPYLEILPLKGQGDLLDIVKITDFGETIMVKAGNMKLTFEKESGTIVNISGGGCPDIPYLHAQLLNKNLEDAVRPKAIGYTLCSLMLDRAFMEARKFRTEGGER